MIFSHLSIPFHDNLFIASIEQDVAKSQPNAFQNEEKISPPLIPFFKFSEADQVRAELCQAKMIDIYGNPLFNFSSFSSLLLHSEQDYSFTISRIFNFLYKPRQLKTLALIEENTTYSLDIPLTFYHYLRHLTECSNQPFILYNSDKQKLQLLPPIPIRHIQLIGSYVIELLQDPLFRHAALKCFDKDIQQERIHQWFEMEHIKQFFMEQSHDYDFRTFSEGTLDYLAYLSNQTLRHHAYSITNFEPSVYINQLKKKHPKYHSIDQQETDEIIIKEKCILEFGGLLKRKLVNLPKTQYAITAFQLVNDKPFECLHVGLINNHPTLENLNLSSTTSLTLSLDSFLICSQEKTCVLKIDCQPFTAAKVLIDLLTDSSTYLEPTIDAWLRFIRNGKRSLQPTIEQAMVDTVLKGKNEFLQLSKLKQKKSLSSFPSLLEEFHLSYYLFFLLKREILKSQVDSQTQQVNPYSVISFLFRACQSLHSHSSLSDQDYANLWRLMNKKSFLQIEKIEIETPNQALLATLKKALIDENVPLSVVSAWMGILSWLWTPLSATDHCQTPVFHFKNPALGFLPIHPIKNSQIIEAYLVKHQLPSSFESLYTAMSHLSHSSSIDPSPLQPYFDQLEINDVHFREMIGRWLTHRFSLLNVMGLQIYLSLASPTDHLMFSYIFQNLPHFLKQAHHFKQSEKIFKTLKVLAVSFSSGYHQILQKYREEEIAHLQRDEWLNQLVQTKDPELLTLAYQLWKKKGLYTPHFPSSTTWSLFRALGQWQPSYSLAILEAMHRMQQLDLPLRMNQVTWLLNTYRKYNAQQFAGHIDRFLPLIYPLFEQIELLQFEDHHQQKSFSQALAFFIDTLYQLPRQSSTGDYFLLEASRRNYLNKKWRTMKWLKRLQQLIVLPRQTLLASSLYQIISQEKLIDVKFFRVDLQRLKIQLGEALLNEQQSSLSFGLLEQLTKEEVDDQFNFSFYTWILHLFTQELTQTSIKDFHFELLDILFRATPLPHRFEAQAKFYECIQLVVIALKSASPPASLITPCLLVQLDQFCSQPEMSLFFIKAEEEWKALLLDYLEASIPLALHVRFPKLWEIYEQLHFLFNKLKTPTHLSRYLKILSLLLKESDQLPPPKILAWIKDKHEFIFHQFKKFDLVHESQTFLFAVNQHQIFHHSLAKYVWWICQKELALPHPSASGLINLLDLETFQNMTQQIQPSHYSLIPSILSILYTDHSQIDRLWQWTEWYLNLPDNQENFEKSLLITICLSCSTHFFNNNQPFQAFYILTYLSFFELSSLQKEKLYDLWMKSILQFHVSGSISQRSYLLLSKEAWELSQINTEQFLPCIHQALQSLLSAAPSLRLSEKKLALDLIKNYFFKEEKKWLILWEALNPNQKEEHFLILQTWNVFKAQAKCLIGSPFDIARCWTRALSCLQAIHHPEVLTYFYDQTWIQTIFNDPLTVHLKWQSLKVVFLEIIETLSPHSFDHMLYEKLMISKNQLLTNERSKELTSEVLEHWNQDLELALIQHLQHSSSPICLHSISILLHGYLRYPINDKKFVESLTLFQQIIHSYVMIEIKEKKNPLPHLYSLADLIFQIIDTIYTHSQTPIKTYLFLVKELMNHQTPDHLKIAQKLASKILNQGSIQEIESLKDSFFIFIPANLKSLNVDTNFLERTEEDLIQSFKIMPLSLFNKGFLSHCYFMAAFDYYLATNPWSEDLIDQLLTLYIRWAPYLFVQSKYLEETLQKVVCQLISYASIQPEDEKKLNFAKFSQSLMKLLNIKYYVQSLGLPAYKDCVNCYHQCLINIIHLYKPNPTFLINSFKMYTEKAIQQASIQKLPVEEALNLIEQLGHLLLPYLAIPEELADKTAVDSQAILKEVVQLAQSKGFFKEYPEYLMMLQVWLDLNLGHPSLIFINKQKLYELTCPILLQLLSYKTGYCMVRAIKLLVFLQRSSLEDSNKFKSLIPYYIEILKRIENNYVTTIIKIGETYQTLFEYFCKETINFYITSNCMIQNQIREIRQRYLQTAQHILQILEPNQETTGFMAHYFSWCLEEIQSQVNKGYFQKKYSVYLQSLKELMPYLILFQFTKINHPAEAPSFSIPTSYELIQQWLFLLFSLPYQTNQKIPFVLKDSEKKEQRSLFFQWLRLLLDVGKNRDSSKICKNLIFSLAILLGNSTQSYLIHVQQKDAVSLFQEIKQHIHTLGNTKERLGIEILSLEFEKTLYEKDYILYLEKASLLLTLFSHVLSDFFTSEKEISPQSQPKTSILLQKLIKYLFIPPPPKDELNIHYFKQRQDIFIRFLTILHTYHEKIAFSYIEQMQESLIDALKIGLEQELLQGDDVFIPFLEWAKNWLASSPYSAALHCLILPYIPQK